jgi:hypothetical protein
MTPLAAAIAVLGVLAQRAVALSPAYIACQIIKPGFLPPTLGCPPGTLFVSQNDTRAHFTSVQAAIASL